MRLVGVSLIPVDGHNRRRIGHQDQHLEHQNHQKGAAPGPR